MVAALAGLAACAAPAPSYDSIALAPDGIRVAGTGLEIGFRRTPDSAEAAMTRLVGPVDRRASGTCDGRSVQVLEWDGLSLIFDDSGFSGWRIGDPADLGRFAFAGMDPAPQAGLACPL